MLMFFNFFRNSNIEPDYLKNCGFDNAFQVSFFKSLKGAYNLPGHFVTSLSKVFGSMKIGQKCNQQWLLEGLSNDLESIFENSSSVSLPDYFDLEADFDGFFSKICQNVEPVKSDVTETKKDDAILSHKNSLDVQKTQAPSQPKDAQNVQLDKTNSTQMKQEEIPVNTQASSKTSIELTAIVSLEKMNQEDAQLEKSQNALKEKLSTVAITQVKNPKKFKPKVVPVFLGIFNKDKDFKETVLTCSRQVLDIVNKKFYNSIDISEQKTLEEDLNEIASRKVSSWKFPNSFHVTTFWVGKEQQRTSSEFFTTFKEKIHFPFEITHIVYVPGYLVCGIPKIDLEKVKIENKYPHVTMMINKWPPRMSNDILNNMFSGGLGNFFKDGSLNYGSVDGNRHVLTMPDKNEYGVYLFKLENSIMMDAETKTYYG